MARWTSDKDKQAIWERARGRIEALGEAARSDPKLQAQVRITFTGREDSGQYRTWISAEGPLWQAMTDCVLDGFLDFDPYPDRYLDEDDIPTLAHAFEATRLIMEAVGASGADLRIRPLPRKRQRNK